MQINCNEYSLEMWSGELAALWLTSESLRRHKMSYFETQINIIWSVSLQVSFLLSEVDNLIVKCLMKFGSRYTMEL